METTGFLFILFMNSMSSAEIVFMLLLVLTLLLILLLMPISPPLFAMWLLVLLSLELSIFSCPRSSDTPLLCLSTLELLLLLLEHSLCLNDCTSCDSDSTRASSRFNISTDDVLLLLLIGCSAEDVCWVVMGVDES